MNIELLFYLADFFDSVSIVFNITICIFIIISLGLFINYMIANTEGELKYDNSPLKKFLHTTKFYILLLILLNCSTPSSKTIYIIIGAHYLKQSTIPQKVELLINKKLDIFLQDPAK